MKFIYENSRGSVVMYGGNGPDFNIIEIRGLSIPDSNVDSVYYPNVAGRKVESSALMERTITLCADVRDKDGHKISRAISIFSMPGTITLRASGRIWKIKARCESFETNKRKGAYTPFVIQLVCDDPYFTDVYDTRVYVYKRENALKSMFVLPGLFSKRSIEAQIINSGDATIEPIFMISSTSGAICPEGILIENLHNGGTIRLNTDISAGEIITVDVKQRKITSNVRGNIISCLNSETSISRFTFDTGISTVRITAKDIEGNISATCVYNNRYISATV